MIRFILEENSILQYFSRKIYYRKYVSEYCRNFLEITIDTI